MSCDLSMAPNLVDLVASLREALASPQMLGPQTKEEEIARLDILDMLPQINHTLIGDYQYQRDMGWSVRSESHLTVTPLPT